MPHKAGEAAFHLESLMADSLEEGALTWFPQSPHKQRLTIWQALGAWERGETAKLGQAVQAQLPEALNAKLKVLHGVGNC